MKLDLQITNLGVDVYPNKSTESLFYELIIGNVVKGDKGDSAYQVWLDNGHTGTEQDFFDWIQQPATDAAAELFNLVGIYNVTALQPLGSGYYTLATSLAAVPADVRKVGLFITFESSANNWMLYQFKGSSTATWTTPSDWVASVFQTTGQSTLYAMSQKATTDALDNKINKDGSNSLIDVLRFKSDTITELSNIGDVRYSTVSGTLEVKISDSCTIQVGEEMTSSAKNGEATTITNGKVVYIDGAVGANPIIKLASTANADIAEKTFAVATEDIATIGRVTTEGLVRDINTSAFAEGALLWLTTNGNLTATEPTSPTPKVCIGVCLRQHATQGIIYVKIRTVGRLQKLSDVYAPTITGGDVLKFNSTNGRFEPFALDTALGSKIDKTAVKQVIGTSETDVISQKGVTDITNEIISDLSDTNIQLDEVDEVATSNYKTLNIGSSGLVTLSPTTRYFTYRVSVLENMILNIDLQRMINQTGSARCRLIIDMPILRTITITKPILWGGTIPTFSAAGQYVFEVIDVDGTGTPLVWQVASTTKAQTTGVILYVDSTGAVYSTEQINGEVATRTTSTWSNPFKYLQNAINAAQAGDIIFIKQGTYKPTHLRTAPTVYAAGNCLDRNATFTMKNGVDVYGGFAGTESKTWQRTVDVQGFPTNQTTLSGDIRSEAVIDSAILIGDRRTEASKANAAYNVVMASAITQLTYLNGVVVMYGNANGGASPTERAAGLLLSPTLVSINNVSKNNTSSFRGGGFMGGVIINSKSVNNTSSEGGGFHSATSLVSCVAMFNRSTSNGGGCHSCLSRKCISVGNFSGGNGGGWYTSDCYTCIAVSNESILGGGAVYNTSVNCSFLSNKASAAILTSSTQNIAVVNCLLYGNKNTSGTAVSIWSSTVNRIIYILNNAYDTNNPTISGAEGSEVDYNTCIPKLTLEQAKIEIPSFVGTPTTPEQVAELEAYIANIATKLRPKTGSILRGVGVKRLVDPITPTTDYDGVQRAETPTIGAFE